MTISLYVLIWILIVHWFADFVLQTDKQAKGKSKNNIDLLNHTLTYSLVWMLTITFCWTKDSTASYYVINSIVFSAITMVLHTITDYFTSRLNTRLWAKGDVHNFFVSVGFDQFLHYVQLIITYYYLNK